MKTNGIGPDCRDCNLFYNCIALVLNKRNPDYDCGDFEEFKEVVNWVIDLLCQVPLVNPVTSDEIKRAIDCKSNK